MPVLRWIDLAIHEFGHVATYVFPDLVTAMMGSITQVALPLAISAYFLRRRELVSGMLCLAWAGTSARDASVYIGDAPYERLPLIGGMHDWAFALGPEGFDALGSAGAVAGVVRAAGLVMVLAAVAGCLARPAADRPSRPRGERRPIRVRACACGSASSSPPTTPPARTPPSPWSAISS